MATIQKGDLQVNLVLEGDLKSSYLIPKLTSLSLVSLLLN